MEECIHRAAFKSYGSVENKRVRRWHCKLCNKVYQIDVYTPKEAPQGIEALDFAKIQLERAEVQSVTIHDRVCLSIEDVYIPVHLQYDDFYLTEIGQQLLQMEGIYSQQVINDAMYHYIVALLGA